MFHALTNLTYQIDPVVMLALRVGPQALVEPPLLEGEGQALLLGVCKRGGKGVRGGEG